MTEDDFISRKNTQEKWLSRRSLIRGAAGTVAGAGLALGARLPALAAVEGEGKYNKCTPLARPIPHITGPGHFFFPGPPDGSAPPSYPNFPFAGFDPSTVTDFEGVIANMDVTVDGKGTDLETGDSAEYKFHADWRFYRGTFVTIDGIERHGTLTFI